MSSPISTAKSMSNYKLLTSSNYREWVGHTTAQLKREKLWGVVIGRDTQAGKDGDALAAWEEKCEQAAGTLYLSVSEDQRIHLQSIIDDPVAMWQKLELVHLNKRPGARFNAYEDLFSIKKADDESLVTMATRIDQAMLDIKNIRPPKFTIDDLDSELCAMSMICALPAEYATLRSTLLLHDNLDKDIIREAFQTEEINRRSDPASLAALAANSTCFFCSKPGHLQVDCGLYKSAKAQALSSQSSGSKKQWRGARKAKEGTDSSTAGANITESAGNASLRSCDPSDPLCPLVHDAQCDWTAETGATAHMTPPSSLAEGLQASQSPNQAGRQDSGVFSWNWISGVCSCGEWQENSNHAVQQCLACP